jgi:hypothetical protein
MRIVLKECAYNIRTEGKSMEQIFKIPKGMIRSIKRQIREAGNFQDAIDYLISEGQNKEALILLVSVWNTIPLSKK